MGEQSSEQKKPPSSDGKLSSWSREQQLVLKLSMDPTANDPVANPQPAVALGLVSAWANSGSGKPCTRIEWNNTSPPNVWCKVGSLGCEATRFAIPAQIFSVVPLRTKRG